MGALLVIPALAARLLAHSPKQMVIYAFIIGQIALGVGLWVSALLDIASGLSIVLTMSSIFFALFCLQKIRSTL